MTATAGPRSELLVTFGGRADGPGILLLPAAGGGVLPYLPLAHRLGERGPVSALRASGLMPGEEPDATVAAAVDRFEPIVRDLAPAVLVGWSMGGLIAWDLAARLATRPTDQAVAPRAVVVVDSAAEATGALTDDEVDAHADLVRAQAVPGAPLGSVEERDTLRAHVRANAEHRLEAHQPVPALVVSCREQPRAEPSSRWQALAAHPVRTAEVPGHHFEVFGPGTVEVLAEHIATFLDSLDRVVAR